jgi:hypothetical protein
VHRRANEGRVGLAMDRDAVDGDGLWSGGHDERAGDE